MRLVLAVILCAAPAWARICEPGTFWSSGSENCLPCSECGAGAAPLLACQPFQDTVCEEPSPPAPISAEQAHRSRLTEERLRSQLEHAGESLQAERTRLETLVVEWQTTVFVVSILVTFALIFSFLVVVLRRTGGAVKKGEF